ncbi:hypothetical protein B9Z55_003348 [Caenorhabditis nigoni]|uniref:C-type lectin domain-containing protein n=2 Tax=Caenorhabditis nigoni TaxID=1611254 RepID=A0A2G5VQ45_9PELO|nr:hypothetical protein B9Z55_003348 [Caenorhabditis nigoni]
MGYNETLKRATYNGWNFKYEETSENWIFESTGVTMCPAPGYKLSVRTKGPWCFSVFPSSEITYAQAVGNCSSKPDSQMSGIETPEEYEHLLVRAWSMQWDNMPRLNAAWLDGVRKPECVGNSSCKGITAFKFTDPLLTENPTGYL